MHVPLNRIQLRWLFAITNAKKNANWKTRADACIEKHEKTQIWNRKIVYVAFNYRWIHITKKNCQCYFRKLSIVYSWFYIKKISTIIIKSTNFSLDSICIFIPVVSSGIYISTVVIAPFYRAKIHCLQCIRSYTNKSKKKNKKHAWEHNGRKRRKAEQK